MPAPGARAPYTCTVRIDALGTRSARCRTTPQVHGLLGQRAISPTPMGGGALRGPQGGILATLAASAASGDARPGDEGVGTTLRASVRADGTPAHHPHHQGEGAIEGVYTDYQVCVRRVAAHGRDASYIPLHPSHTPLIQVRRVSAHGRDAFAHSRFECPVAPA